MNNFDFPVFVKLRDCGDVRSYHSVAEMQRNFEEIDVENGEYEAWDAKATPLKLSVQKQAAWLVVEPAGKPQPELLANAIAEFARIQNVQVDTSRLHHGDFSNVLERTAVAIREKRQAEHWSQKLRRHF